MEKGRVFREDLLTHNPDLTVLHFWDIGQWGSNSFGDNDVSKNAIKRFIKIHVLEMADIKSASMIHHCMAVLMVVRLYHL